MGVKVSDQSFKSLLSKLFGDGPTVQTAKIAMMVESGATVKAGLLNFLITVPPYGDKSEPQVFAAKLSELSVNIINGAANGTKLLASKHAVNDVIEQAFTTYPGWSKPFSGEVVQSVAPVIPEVKSVLPPESVPYSPKKKSWTKKPKESADMPDFLTATGPSNKELNAAFAAATAGAHLQAAGFEPVKVSSPIPLSDARSVGQKVKGTGSGSVYRSFAIGPVNLAVKVAAGQASIRAEAQGKWLPAHKSKLTAMGFSDNGTYMSVHMNLGDVPAVRVLGAIAFSLDMKFNQIATSMEAINE